MANQPDQERAGTPGGDPADADPMARLLGSSMQLWGAWARTWQTLLTERGMPATDSVLRMLGDPWGWVEEPERLQAELERATDIPRFADLPAPDSAVLRSWEPAIELAQAGAAYARAAAWIWSEIGRRLQADIAERNRQGRSPRMPGELLDAWTSIVDQVLLEYNRSPELAEVQRRYVRAAMRCRRDQQRLTDQWAEAWGRPTRAEVDAIHLRLHDLSRRVRRLDRKLSELLDSQPGARPADSSGAAPDAAAETPASRRRPRRGD